MNSQEGEIRRIEYDNARPLKELVYERVNGAIERSSASKQVWLVALDDELRPQAQVCAYCDDEDAPIAVLHTALWRSFVCDSHRISDGVREGCDERNDYSDADAMH